MSGKLIQELGIILREEYGTELDPTALAEVANTLTRWIETLLEIEQGSE